jgi:hypothetical protein
MRTAWGRNCPALSAHHVTRPRPAEQCYPNLPQLLRNCTRLLGRLRSAESSLRSAVGAAHAGSVGDGGLDHGLEQDDAGRRGLLPALRRRVLAMQCTHGDSSFAQADRPHSISITAREDPAFSTFIDEQSRGVVRTHLVCS